MFKFCQDRSSIPVKTLASDIRKMKNLDMDELYVTDVSKDFACFEVFVLWDALGRDSGCSALVQLLTKIGAVSESEERKKCRQCRKIMVDLNALSRKYVKATNSDVKKQSIAEKLQSMMWPSGQSAVVGTALHPPVLEEVNKSSCIGVYT